MNETPQETTGTDEDFEKHVQAVLDAERKLRIKWTIIGLLILVSAVGTVLIVGSNTEFWFRPKPDMEEVNKRAFKKTNDPVCREMLDKVDVIRADWESVQAELRDLYTKGKPEDIAKGRQKIAGMIAAYKVEQRRRQIIIAKESFVHEDLAEYFKHVIFYLTKMDRLLSEHGKPSPVADADAGGIPEIKVDPDTGEVEEIKVNFPNGIVPPPVKAVPPADAYSASWRKVVEDHDKWRVYRQGPTPCGPRTGPIPELPAEDAPLVPTAKPAPKAPVETDAD